MRENVEMGGEWFCPVWDGLRPALTIGSAENKHADRSGTEQELELDSESESRVG